MFVKWLEKCHRKALEGVLFSGVFTVECAASYTWVPCPGEWKPNRYWINCSLSDHFSAGAWNKDPSGENDMSSED